VIWLINSRTGKKNILLLGGARSGKSRLALELAQNMTQQVLFVATATAGDEDMRVRITKHRLDRPSNWRTLEAPVNIGSRITAHMADARLVIIDCITLLLNNIYCRYDDHQFDAISDPLLEAEVVSEINGILECTRKPEVSFIIISNEVGLGIVPDNRIGRLYRDHLGRANQMLAAAVDEVLLLVAGIPLRIKPR
jgi:adenosylcobinamide kinase/adenosylcobinamide-phosphate guanylyltransferase